MMFITEDIAKNDHKGKIEIIQDTTKQLKKDYFQPDTFVFSKLEKSSFTHGSFYFETVINPIKEENYMGNDNFLQQGDFIGLGNEIFEGSKPLTGEAYDVLIKVLYKNSQKKSTTKGML